jgi:hypothetical protein
MVLPHRQPERDGEREHRHDDARAQLVEMVDDSQPVLMGDRPDAAQGRPGR